ncbi:MAG: hypothetical protein QM831_09840 [Kofleriaceae bacterium]
MNELEDALAEDPFDESQWLVLEDWLLQHGDPRARLVELEKQGLPTRDALDRLAPQLLGTQHAKLREHLYQQNWRAGYLRECQFTGNGDLIAALVAAPATRLLRSLVLTMHLDTLDRAVGLFAEAPCGRSLRIVGLSSWSESKPIAVAGSTLEKLPELRHLILRGVYVDAPPRLAKLDALTLAPMRLGVTRLHDQLKQHRWPRVTTLTIEYPEMHETDFDHQLPASAAAVMPAVRRIRVTGIPRERLAMIERTLVDRGLALELITR